MTMGPRSFRCDALSWGDAEGRGGQIAGEWGFRLGNKPTFNPDGLGEGDGGPVKGGGACQQSPSVGARRPRWTRHPHMRLPSGRKPGPCSREKGGFGGAEDDPGIPEGGPGTG